MQYILGISCYYHDSAACLLADGVIVAAAQQERFSRIKHDPAFPVDAIRYCLAQADMTGATDAIRKANMAKEKGKIFHVFV